MVDNSIFMRAYIQKLDAVCQKYTQHEFIHATLLGVAGLLAMTAFFAPAITGAV